MSSLDTPTTAEINDLIIAQLEASLNQTIPLLPRSFNRVLAKALSGVYILLYKYGNWMFLQLFVAYASFNTTVVLGVRVRPLVEWGRLIGVGDPLPATPAEYRLDVTVQAQGGTLQAGTQLRNPDTGVVYLTSQSVLLDAPTVSVDVVAVLQDGLGTPGNVQVGAQLTFANTQADLAQQATVTAELVTGTDPETEAAYRRRVVVRFQRPPRGGAYADYDEWGRTAAGVANIYPYTGDPGRVSVYVESATEPDGIPTQAQLDAVADAIELDDAGLASRRPANAFVDVYPITRRAFAVTVYGLSVANEADVRDEIDAAVAAYFTQREPYIPGLSVPPRQDRITRSAVSGVVERIVSEAGGIFSQVQLDSSGVIELYVLGEGEKAEASGVSYA